MSPVPDIRIRIVNNQPIRPDGQYVLHWMIAFRRTTANFALERALEAARALERPLVVLEALRVDYPHASDRLHRFVLAGMADNARAFSRTRVSYLPYVEGTRHEGDGLIEVLARHACLVVTDDYPSSFLPSMLSAVAARLRVRLEAIDSNGLIPIRVVNTTFSTAHSFRSYLQRTFRDHLGHWPSILDFSGLQPPPRLDNDIARWQMATAEALNDPSRLISALPIDHGVGPGAMSGGSATAQKALQRFISDALPRYDTDAKQPDICGTSRLSPYLHFGHLSSHEIFSAVATAERWTTRKLGAGARGSREGWWGMSRGAEAFLDQLVTWRELGFNMCATRPDDYWRFESLPDWARATLGRHARDRREHVYSREVFEQAATHDPVWNAAQRQLLRDGWMHNYLRMLWGKKILEWSASPEEALDTMIAIMDKHAVDGRDPNSYSGYCWTLGRYDRPWGPERPVFGTVRYMSSENTVKKLRMKRFLQEYGPSEAPSRSALI